MLPHSKKRAHSVHHAPRGNGLADRLIVDCFRLVLQDKSIIADSSLYEGSIDAGRVLVRAVVRQLYRRSGGDGMHDHETEVCRNARRRNTYNRHSVHGGDNALHAHILANVGLHNDIGVELHILIRFRRYHQEAPRFRHFRSVKLMGFITNVILYTIFYIIICCFINRRTELDLYLWSKKPCNY